MLVLAVDTSTPQVTAGVVKYADDAYETLAFEGHVDARAHNEVLTPLLLECLQTAGLTSADLDAVVVGVGPGPFTGLRVGMATAASFAAALDIPCHGVCSLDAVVRSHDLAGASDDAVADAPGLRLAVTDARRREVYAAAYRGTDRVWGPDVAKAAEVLAKVTAAVPDGVVGAVIGSEKHCAEVAAGAPGGQESSGMISVHAQYPTPAGLVAAADLSATPEALVPMYLRRPDATPPKPKPKSAAIPDIDLSAL
ncbi:tRNA (adenosine(37)-N6)-threonylcarbamoyltransferase complex dimerization subunit type 1 TsaB [Corynebacterium sp. H78]|uniref:tRNA (adenosine(37)-N6)-threonylcarbamoyltransferase complex dimerization subunit type 1 TsaB n=1 Tax=Corynebacterium sp. H78 TaxID=3133417 RepID=UPI0030A5E6A6